MSRASSCSAAAAACLLVIAAGTAPGDSAADSVVINEILFNPVVTPDTHGEWFEVFNPGERPVDIDGWTIVRGNVQSHVIDGGGPLLVPAGAYFVLGIDADTSTNGGAPVDYEYGRDILLPNNGSELVLLDAQGDEVDRAEWYPFGARRGYSIELVHPALDNSGGLNWTWATSQFGDGDYGTPGAENDALLTPSDAIPDLADQVDDLVDAGVLSRGQGNALSAKLSAALAKVERGQSASAANQIEAFVNQVEAFVAAGVLSETEGLALLDAAELILLIL